MCGGVRGFAFSLFGVGRSLLLLVVVGLEAIEEVLWSWVILCFGGPKFLMVKSWISRDVPLQLRWFGIQLLQPKIQP